ncbi:MAG: type IVB secretion system protein IcmH/DotU, partial [Pseudomonadota bacterium]
MADDDDDRTVFGQKLPAPPAPKPRPRAQPPAAETVDDDRTILSRRPTRPGQASVAQLPLAAALQSRGRTAGHASNPVMATASDLLELLGLLRTGLVEMQSQPLRTHLQNALVDFEPAARAAGVVEQDITDARYALAATCDDIAQNLPGTDLTYWKRNSLTVEFFDDPNPGVGFFTRLHRLSGNPQQHAMVLEVMFACLALGFEGQYR